MIQAMTINQIFDFLQYDREEKGTNPFDTDTSNAAIDALLSRVTAKDKDVSIDLMGLIVDERKLAFSIGFKAACSLMVEGLGATPLASSEQIR